MRSVLSRLLLFANLLNQDSVQQSRQMEVAKLGILL